MKDLAALLKSRLTWGVGVVALAAALLANLNKLGPMKVFFVCLLLGLLISSPITLLLRHTKSATPAAPIVALYLGALATFLAATTVVFLNRDFRDWLFRSEAELAVAVGRERIVLEAARFERGDTDGDGVDDRLRARFSVRNVGTSSALVNRVLIGYHLFPRVGGGSYTSIWLDGEVLAAHVDGGTRIYTLEQRDHADDTYRIKVRAHVYYFGACGHDELIWVNAVAEVPQGELRQQEVNLPLQLTMTEGTIYADEDGEPFERDEPVELFLPRADALPPMCVEGSPGFEAKYSLTATTTSGQCRTIVIYAESLRTTSIDEVDDQLERSYLDGLCEVASDPHAAGVGIDPG